MQFSYIDPGTGSMLFTILVGILSASIFMLRNVFLKLGFILSGGKKTKSDKKEIPFVIFTDSKRYWNIFGPICEEFEKRGKPMVYMTASPDDPALSRHFEHVKCEFVGEGNKAYAKLNMIHATIVLSSTPGLDVYQWKRSKDAKYYVHILHGVNDALYRMYGLDYFDSVLLSGQHQVKQLRELEELRHLPAKDMVIVGQPYMDGLYERLQNTPPLADHPMTVLLAPTWGDTGTLKRYGRQVIDALLATGYHIIVRPHPQSFVSEKEMMDELMAAYPDSDQFEWNRDNDNFDVLNRADIMISDFSGVIFDYALVFDKPIIYADITYDKAPYDAYWIKDEMWTLKVLPKIGQQLTADNLDHIKDVIDECLTQSVYKENRDAVRAECWEHIGESTSLTVDYLLAKYDEIKEKEAKEAAELEEKRNLKKTKKQKKAVKQA